MAWRPGIFRVPSRLAVALATLLLPSSPAAWAQAWVPPAGAGAVTIATQTIHNTGHTDTFGGPVPEGASVNTRIDLEVDYAFTDRFSITASLPFVAAKYLDPNPPSPPIPYLPVDACHCWNSGWQDVGVTARYNLRNGAFALTPSVSIGVPTHDYDFRGEAVLGPHLKELRLAIDAGQRLDAISSRLSVEGHYAYALVERVLDLPNNRSNAAVQTGVLITRRLAATAQVTWQRVHGGLRFGGAPSSELPFPGEVNTPERMFEHDRLLRDNYWRVGGGIAYSFTRWDVFASYVAFVRGTDSHRGRAFTAGISWPFEIGGRPSP